MGDFKLRWVVLACASIGVHLMGHFRMDEFSKYMGDFNATMGRFKPCNGRFCHLNGPF